MIILKSESVHYPQLLDKDSSPTTIYVRENIEEKQREDEDGEVQIYYTYTEKQFTKEEYKFYELEQVLADLTELTLEVSENA